jgi:hypothetical protein
MGGRKKRRKKSYTKKAHPSAEQLRRYKVVLRALTGEITMIEGARCLGVSRPRFQDIVNRGEVGLLREIGPKDPGRPAKSEEQKRLEELESENRDLREATQEAEKTLELVSDLVKEMSGKGESSLAGGLCDEEGEEPSQRSLVCALMARARGYIARLAKALGISERTLRRWQRSPERTQDRPGVATGLECKVVELVRASRGLIGVASMHKSVPGISRRQVSEIKKREVRDMEKQRRREATRLRVKAPGVLRGFDQLYVPSTVGNRIALWSMDGCIPYRTSVHLASAYDGENVLEAISRDIELNGAPYVLRMDNDSAHKVQPVRDLLAEHGVLILHGPPRYPQYYGQTERQNEEHRAWLKAGRLLTEDSIEPDLQQAMYALNCLWRRRTLGWCTAAELWAKRPALEIDRDELNGEVTERAQRILRKLEKKYDTTKDANHLAWRLAIEQVLEKRGLIEQVKAGWC